jgi:alkylresorcinol/alkylpyrone synthase
MPAIRSVSTALPPYVVHQTEARQFAQTHFASVFPHIERYLPVFHHAEIDTRSFVVPAEWFLQPRSFQECNNLFIEWAVRLSETSAHQCLNEVGLTPQDVDHLILVSTTGLATPSIDAHLLNRLNMNQHTRRTPVWGLGCAGGVAGLSRAYEYTLAFPHHRALLVCVELCSITFQWNDFSKRNFIAAAIFSDGAAAVLVEGDEVPPPATASTASAPRILGTRSTLWPDTLDIMGWEIIDTGMQVVFSSRIPVIVQEWINQNVSEFLAPYHLKIDDITQFILHPGGAKVIRAYVQSLQIDSERLNHVRNVLRDHGNMSSPTVFFVYEAFAREHALQPGEYGLLVVLGPGFSSEMALIQG